MEKRKRRFGDRKDGRKLRTISPMHRLEFFIMKDRNDALNLFSDSFEISAAEQYIRKKKAEGLKNFGLLHVILAGYVRTLASRPALNRFVSGQTLYARNCIEVVMTIKKEMSIESPDTCIKVKFDPHDTAEDIYNKFNKVVEENQSGAGDSDFDKTAEIFNRIPRPLLRLIIRFLNWLDYHGKLPQPIMDISPFHGSFIITSLGSLGIPPVFHHIYNFGNLPIFLAYGAKRYQMVMNAEGQFERKVYVDYTVVTDERICDGYYFASSLKMLKRILKNPAVLDEPPETVAEDID